jgi:tRNA(Ser,Leu) C12 N-acetylase TAN1
MRDWNVVVTVHEQRFVRACQLLEQFGAVGRTSYYNVLVMKVDDTGRFLKRLAELTSNVPEVLDAISRVVPAARTFDFQSAEEFQAKAREIALEWVPELANKSFHVRLHRRGREARLQSTHEEQILDEALLEALAAKGTPGRITFEDPDLVVAVETVSTRAGVSIWTREDLGRYPFLRLD